jgi:hypothetical protein
MRTKSICLFFLLGLSLQPAHAQGTVPTFIAVGFLTGYTSPTIVGQAMDYIISGKAPVGTRYKLRQPTGYPIRVHRLGSSRGSLKTFCFSF